MPDILIFDDDPDIAALLGEVLRGRGFSVAHYPSADGIIQIVRENRPRLVFLDIMMPGLDGLSACRNMRSDPAIRHVKIVVITAKQFEQDRATAQRYGADLFVNKPLDCAKLGQEISRLLGGPQQVPAAVAQMPPLTITMLASGAVVESLDMWILLDAGRGLGQWVSTRPAFPKLCWMLLSRYEPSVLEELGACASLFSAGSIVKLAGPEDADSTLSHVAHRLASGLPPQETKAPLVFVPRAKATPLLYPLREGEFSLNTGALGVARHAHHPGSALAYRLEIQGRKLVYCPCNEIRLDDVSWNKHELKKFRSFFQGADLLIHGYRRSQEQPRPTDGMGTCAWEPVVDMAADAGVNNLMLFPLAGAPRDVLAPAQARSASSRSPLRCLMASTGQTYVL